MAKLLACMGGIFLWLTLCYQVGFAPRMVVSFFQDSELKYSEEHELPLKKGESWGGEITIRNDGGATIILRGMGDSFWSVRGGTTLTISKFRVKEGKENSLEVNIQGVSCCNAPFIPLREWKIIFPKNFKKVLIVCQKEDYTLSVPDWVVLTKTYESTCDFFKESRERYMNR